MSYCSKCGAQLLEGMRFCGRCGAPTGDVPAYNPNPTPNPAYPGYQPAPPISKRKGKKLPILITGIAAAAVVVLILFFTVFNNSANRTPDAPIRTVVDTIVAQEVNAKKIMSALPPSLIQEIEENYGFSEDAMELQLNSYLTDTYDDLPSNWSFSYSLDEPQYYDIWSLEELRNTYKEEGFDSFEIQNAASINFNMHSMSLEGGENYNTMTLVVIQVDGKWYMEFESFGELVD